MKRSGPPERRTPLKAKKGLDRGTSQLKRTRLNPVSEKMKAKRPEKARVRAAVFARDGHCVLLDLDPDHRCFGRRLTYHHLWKDGQGGPYSEENGVTLCAGGNSWVEDEPKKAEALGLVVRHA